MGLIDERISEGHPDRRSLEHVDLPDPGLHDRVSRLISHDRGGDWSPCAVDRTFYLDLMERIVRTAADWQNADGAIIDPAKRNEHAQTTPRFASPGAILLHFGRIPDLAEAVFRAMDWACTQLASAKCGSSDFWMRELATAWMCLEGIADTERHADWKATLASVDPETVYKSVRPDGEGLEELHNWTVYAAAGESMRETARIGATAKVGLWGNAFFEKYMPAQLTHFNSHGMYRDPNDPITYDITTRLQVAAALAFGYDGPLRGDLDELLRRGGLSMLLFISPEGYVPFGGRSSQFQFQEAIVSALSELEARRYRDSSGAFSGAFKRLAHLSAQSVSRWTLEMDPFRCVKNGFPPQANHGHDDYAAYSCYGLLTASFLGLASLFADDEIAEKPIPADHGGCVFELADSFHKVFASCRDTYVEIDTRADFNYDSTGLGRFLVKDVPMELGVAMPFTMTPHYTVAAELRRTSNMAVGPSWLIGGERIRLADLSEGLTCRMPSSTETASDVRFTLQYNHPETRTTIEEEYRLTTGKMRLRSSVSTDGQPASSVCFHVPLLVTDGDETSIIEEKAGEVSVCYRGSMLTVSFEEDLAFSIDAKQVANRNGIYRELSIEAADSEIAVDLALNRVE